MRALALATALIVVTSAAQAADINAFIATAIKSATDELLPAFELANGHTIRASYAPSGALVPRFNRGEPVDVFLTDAPALDELTRQGKIAGGRIDLGRTGIGIAVRKGAPKPDVSTPEALKRALLRGEERGPCSPTSGSITGGHIMRMFEKLGIADQITPKTKLSMGGPNSRVSVLISSGEAEIGLQQASELLDNPDVEMIGLLPVELQQFVYVAGVTASAKEPDAARALIAFIATRPPPPRFSKPKASG